ncbi:hypothetical protein [Tahibacter harae]|uniref:Uncharacterized protein n=1 Tax=Tahibacter harae TaxID=2963937 RepID=A0ABT1QPX6_9GAMM|nr:hypothetical protein [Tahibacter harae]MCQ4164334.1 hypothetical protein [Tahibacter harae]
MGAPDEIEVLTAVEAMHRRPEMYLDMDDPALGEQFVLQTLCHAVDEAMDGRCSRAAMQLGRNGARCGTTPACR